MTEQEGLFDNPPPPIFCGHRNCKKEVAFRRIGDRGRFRWVHAVNNVSQCYPSGTQWAFPAEETVCSRCDKLRPTSFCWDGCRAMGECPLGYLAQDIEEGPQVVRDQIKDGTAPITATGDLVYKDVKPSYASDWGGDLVARSEAHARRSDPSTSHEAAASIKSEELRRSQLGVIAMFQQFGPMHDQLLVERYGANGKGHPEQSESGIRTRRKELVDQGVLEDSGKKIILDSGRRSIIWRMWKP